MLEQLGNDMHLPEMLLPPSMSKNLFTTSRIAVALGDPSQYHQQVMLFPATAAAIALTFLHISNIYAGSPDIVKETGKILLSISQQKHNINLIDLAPLAIPFIFICPIVYKLSERYFSQLN